uniref:Uncharacterized protein n=1 Tax=Globisporangium ultimum (strain ATCC 200006 / CBS 805.95 / DAOM BR144) TaxID=431595 RepID=K3X4Q6_GLOUD
MQSAGVQLPDWMSPGEFHTLKVEVGLEERANEWAQFPGVEYVLCVYLTQQLDRCEFKLFSVVHDANARLDAPVDPIPIVDPATLVAFESHRLLGLPPDAEAPRAFSQSHVVLN